MRDISDESLRDALESAVDAVRGDDSAGIVSVGGVLRGQATDDDDPLRALVAALEYHLVVDPDAQRGYGPFGPMIEMGATIYPAPLDRIDDPAIFALWKRALDESSEPLVTARFADLLWEARFGDRPHEHALAAVDAYLRAADNGFGHDIEIREGLERALDLGTQINDRVRQSAVVAALMKLARESLAGPERAPGVVLPIVEALVKRRPADRPADLASLLDDAIARYGDDPWLLESALNIKARLSEPADREALHAAQAEAFADLARRSEGILKYAHLQHALEIAEQHGLRALADTYRREVESISEDDLDLKSVSAEVEVPRDQIDEFISQIVGDDSLESALARFGSHIPTGRPDENREFIKQLMAEHPLQYIMPTMVIGPENSLVHAAATPEEHEEQALIEHELRRLSFYGIFAVDILERLRERYGPLSASAGWFTSDLIESVVAERIGRALALYEEGDWDAAAFVLAPRVERIVRSLARAVGIPITRSADSRGHPGGVKTLGVLLADLDGILDEGSRRYLRNLLVEITGMNVRNRVGHALLDLASQQEAALLIHAACHLRLLVPTPREQSSET